MPNKSMTVTNKLDLSTGVKTETNVELPESHYRLCYRRPQRDYRMRDERSGDLYHVKGYAGDINLNWLDGGSHIFHDGKVFLDENYIAHLIDTSLEESRSGAETSN